MISKGFIKSSFIYTVIGALPLATSLILLPFYTSESIGLDTGTFGHLAILLSFSLLIQVLVNFGLDTAIGVHYFEMKNDRSKLNVYVGTVATTLLIWGAFFTLFALSGGDQLFMLLFKGEIDFYPYGLIVVLTAVFNSFFKTYTNLLINQQRPERFFWMNMLYFVLVMGFSFGGLLIYPHTLAGPLGGRFIGGAILFLLVLFLFSREFGLTFSIPVLRKGIPFCAPVLVFYLLAWVMTYIDRYIINYMMTDHDVGIYDFGTKCTAIIDFVLVGLINSITPRVFQAWTDSKVTHSTPEVNKYYNVLTAITMIAVAFTIFIIPVAVPLVVPREDYYTAFNYTALLGLAFMFKPIFYLYTGPIYFFKKTRVLPWVFIISAALQVTITVVLIKYYDLAGAVWATLLAKPLQNMILLYESRKIFSFQLNYLKQVYMPLLYGAIVVIGEWTVPRQYLVPLYAGELMIACAMVAYVYKKEIKGLTSIFTSRKPAPKP